MKPCLYYIYNTIAFLLCLMICAEVSIDNVKKAVVNGCLYSLLINTVGLIISAAKGRATGFFNNPNQLGYYALLILTFYTIFRKDM